VNENGRLVFTIIVRSLGLGLVASPASRSKLHFLSVSQMLTAKDPDQSSKINLNLAKIQADINQELAEQLNEFTMIDEKDVHSSEDLNIITLDTSMDSKDTEVVTVGDVDTCSSSDSSGKDAALVEDSAAVATLSKNDTLVDISEMTLLVSKDSLSGDDRAVDEQEQATTASEEQVADQETNDKLESDTATTKSKQEPLIIHEETASAEHVAAPVIKQTLLPEPESKLADTTSEELPSLDEESVSEAGPSTLTLDNKTEASEEYDLDSFSELKEPLTETDSTQPQKGIAGELVDSIFNPGNSDLTKDTAPRCRLGSMQFLRSCRYHLSDSWC
jgi:hypothetical protein